jgi:hypothetical protein
MSLLCALPSCIPAVGADPLIITVAKNGSDEPACLEGKIACNTFMYASKVNGNGNDVTMVITYPQILPAGYSGIKIGLNVSNLKLVGQVENFNFTFLCWDYNIDPPQLGNMLELLPYSRGNPKQLLLENVLTLCKGPLYTEAIDSIILTEFIGQGLILHSVKNVHIEDSAFFCESINIGYGDELTSFTVKNSLLVQKGRGIIPLIRVDLWNSNLGVLPDVSILIENTDFELHQPRPPPNQPATMLLNLQTPIGMNSIITSVNFTISECNFVNYNSTAIEVDVQDAIIVKDIYLNILDSNFRVTPDEYNFDKQNFVVVSQGRGVPQTNVHTRLDGNTFKNITK